MNNTIFKKQNKQTYLYLFMISPTFTEPNNLYSTYTPVFSILGFSISNKKRDQKHAKALFISYIS